MRSIVVALSLLIVACPASLPRPDDVRNFHWGDRVPYSTTVVTDADVTVRHAPSAGVSVLFQTLRVDLQGTSSDHGAAAISAMSLPLDPGRAGTTPIRCQVRGDAVVPSGARAAVLVQLGEKTATYQFSADEAAFTREIGMSIAGGGSRPFPITIVATAVRPTTGSAIRIEVDSLDCSVAFEPPVS